MNKRLQQLHNHLDLEKIDENLYRTTHENEGWHRVYGGQVLGQALLSATRTVEPDRKPHSLHGYFLRPGDLNHPIIYQVDRIRDGKSFTTRRVVGIQHGKAIFNMSASFQVTEEGLSHQTEMPEAPSPEDCVSREQVVEKYKASIPEDRLRDFLEGFAIELREVDPQNYSEPEPKPANKKVWLRLNTELPIDYPYHNHVLAYASDLTLIQTSLRPHGLSWANPKLQVASLDHAMWFHRPFRIDQWLLYVQDSPSGSAARGFSRGSFFTQSGELVASTAQEGLMRLHP